MSKKLYFVVAGDCNACDEIAAQIDPSIPVIDLGDMLEKPGLEKLCPDDNCRIPQFAVIDDEKGIVEAFPEERWNELTEENIARLLSNSEPK
ncbi:MAG: hypothetical protein WC551_09700 [Patescibacteria group bacterium]